MKQINILAIAAITFILLLPGCKKETATTPTGPGTNEVWMQNNTFSPTTITVPVNTTVKWTNKDGTAHTVTSNSGAFDSGKIDAGGTYSYKFTSAGNFPYKCIYHSGMTGTVVVQ